MKQEFKTTRAQANRLATVQTGKVKLKVRSVSPMFEKKDKDGNSLKDKIVGYIGSVLINFAAYDPRKTSLITERFGDEDEADISDLTFTHEVLIIEGRNQTLPTKGDVIDAYVDYAIKKDGEFVLDIAENKVMQVTSFSVPAAKELSIGNLFKAATSESSEDPERQSLAVKTAEEVTV